MTTAQKISELTTAGPLTGAELVPIVQSGGTLQTTVSVIAAFTLVSISPVVSALQTQIDQVSAIAAADTSVIASLQADVSVLDIRVATVSAVTSVNAAAITSVNNTVSALEVRVSSVSAAVVSANAVIAGVSVLTSINAAAITSVNAVISALDVRVSILEAAVSNIGDVSAIAGLVSNVAALENDVSVLTIRIADVSASVSALQIQLNAVSALTSVNAAAITSVNNVVSALEIRVSSASATGVNNAAAITSINAVISSLAISVSADVSAKVNRIGDYMDSVQYIEFDTSTSYAVSVGRLTWDIEYGTLDIGLAGGNSNVLIGQREVMYVYNNTAATLPKGKVVEVTGAQGQRLTVKLAQADSDANSATVLGIMMETVSVNASGYVATNGIVRNVDTGAFTDGQIVYLSPTSAGDLTATKPAAPQHMVMIGYIVKGGSVGAGSVYVKTQNGYELGELHDVKTSTSTSLADGEVLAYNTSAGVWTNSTALINTQASVSALNIQVAAVSALTSANAASITSANAVIAAVSALVSALDIRVAAVSASVSALQIQLNDVSAALTSTNNVVSALEIRVSSASATGVTNAAAITSINNVVSAVQAQVNAVSVSVGQRVLKAGDTMTGALTISTSADAQSLTVNGYGTFTSRISVRAGFYTGLQNYQDHTVQRPTFRDYALVLVARGSVSATATLDMTEGNFFSARVAGSTTFVFANPPVSVTGASGGAAGGFILELQNGGAATITWPAAVDWPGGSAPTLTASGFDVFVFITDDGGTVWRGVLSMKDSK